MVGGDVGRDPDVLLPYERCECDLPPGDDHIAFHRLVTTTIVRRPHLLRDGTGLGVTMTRYDGRLRDVYLTLDVYGSARFPRMSVIRPSDTDEEILIRATITGDRIDGPRSALFSGKSNARTAVDGERGTDGGCPDVCQIFRALMEFIAEPDDVVDAIVSKIGPYTKFTIDSNTATIRFLTPTRDVRVDTKSDPTPMHPLSSTSPSLAMNDAPETIEIPLSLMVAKAAAMGSVAAGAASNSIFTAVGGAQGYAGAAAATSGAKTVGLGVAMAWGVPVLLGVGAVVIGGAVAVRTYRAEHTLSFAVYSTARVGSHIFVRVEDESAEGSPVGSEGGRFPSTPALTGILTAKGRVDARGRAREMWHFSFARIGADGHLSTDPPTEYRYIYVDGRRDRLVG